MYGGETQTRVVMREPGACEQWEYWRRIGGSRGFKPGEADGSKEARTCVHPLTLVCRRAGCGALVDWHACKVAAGASGRKGVAAGAGCANPRHDARRGKDARASARPARRYGEFDARQRAMARSLRSGKRILVEWPTAYEDVNVWQRPHEAMEDAATRAEARTGGETEEDEDE